MKHTKPMFVILSLLLFVMVSRAYVTQIHASAVLENENQGILTLITLNVTSGNGGVTINGPSSVDLSTTNSAREAVSYAASYLGVTSSLYNFNYTIGSNSSKVSGPSAGLAFTLLAISALEHKQLAQNFSVTGTIETNGSVGQIGGVYDKIGAAKDQGMHFMIVPSAPDSSFEGLLYYVSQQLFGIPVVEVSNVPQALPYALSGAAAKPLNSSVYQNYDLGSLNDSNVTCSSCNASAFAVLVNSTFNFTRSYIENISSNFSAARQALLKNLNEYRTIAGKGYLYTAADFSFLDFLKAFTLYNAQDFNASDVNILVSNISSYCSSLIPPPLTNLNYEYVTGGRLRQLWGNTSISEAKQILDSAQTTDDIAQSVYTAASSFGWCEAASMQYDIASQIGGNYVSVSPGIKTDATALINRARGFGNNMYLQSALQAYSSGDYATALYAAEYANAFGRSVSLANLTNSQIVSAVSDNMRNATLGIWPSQFSRQAEFYLWEAGMANNRSAETDYLGQAYTTSVLARGLASANSELSTSFIISNVTMPVLTGQISQEISSIQQDISQIYLTLFIIAALLFVILVVLLVHMLAHRTEPRSRKRKR